jgi:hypothetical protein
MRSSKMLTEFPKVEAYPLAILRPFLDIAGWSKLPPKLIVQLDAGHKDFIVLEWWRCDLQ